MAKLIEFIIIHAVVVRMLHRKQFWTVVLADHQHLLRNHQSRCRQIITATFVTPPIFLAPPPLPETHRDKMRTLLQYVTRANRAWLFTAHPSSRQRYNRRMVIIVSMPNDQTFEFM